MCVNELLVIRMCVSERKCKKKNKKEGIVSRNVFDQTHTRFQHLTSHTTSYQSCRSVRIQVYRVGEGEKLCQEGSSAVSESPSARHFSHFSSRGKVDVYSESDKREVGKSSTTRYEEAGQ